MCTVYFMINDGVLGIFRIDGYKGVEIIIIIIIIVIIIVLIGAFISIFPNQLKVPRS